MESAERPLRNWLRQCHRQPEGRQAPCELFAREFIPSTLVLEPHVSADYIQELARVEQSPRCRFLRSLIVATNPNCREPYRCLICMGFA
eukprot:scaffold95256_cov31-Tisochrysis_lutea.AAC.2